MFDEIEKAHADVFNIFLQILDEGRLTDGKGRTVDFKNTVIIMTSNIGSHMIHEAMNSARDGEPGKLSEDLKKNIRASLLDNFRPEFLNRVDEVVIFNALGKEELAKIIDLQLNHLRGLLADRKITIELTPAARDLLFESGYDPQFGARPLKRAIQRLIQDPLALKILEGEVKSGETIEVDADAKKGEMTFTPAKTKAVRG